MTQHWHRALVTGASSGIGREMARQLGEAGTELVVVARDTGRLEELAAELAVPVEVFPADLSDLDAVGRVARRLTDDNQPIDLLVNNAGLGFSGDFVDIPPERGRLMLAVNVAALHELSHSAAKAMTERGGGTILNVSSVAGDLPGPRTATYNATKAFVTSFSEALHVELKPHNVVVSALCPGLTRTEFQERAEVDTSALPDLIWQSAADVARCGLKGAADGKPVVISGALNRIGSRVARSVPRSVSRWTAARAGGK